MTSTPRRVQTPKPNVTALTQQLNTSLRRKAVKDTSDISVLMQQIKQANESVLDRQVSNVTIDEDDQIERLDITMSVDESSDLFPVEGNNEVISEMDSNDNDNSYSDLEYGEVFQDNEGYNEVEANDPSVLFDPQEVNTDTSTAFDRVVRHIMARKKYSGQVVKKSRPGTLSCPAAKSSNINRFPTSAYVTQKLDLMKDALKNASNITTVSATGKKHIQKFFKPPPFLSRVSEVGDPVRNSESTKQPPKTLGSTPVEWSDVLSDLQVSDKHVLGKAYLQPTEARSVELASKWGTKVLNYVDHFAEHAQSLQTATSVNMKKVKEYVESISKLEDGTISLPKDISTALSKMESKHNDSIFCIQELANLIPAAMDSTIYTQATLELHRRDDLLTVLNYNVSNIVKRELRLSKLGQEHVFDPEVCSKAAKEVSKKIKSGEIKPRRGGGNFRGGRKARRGKPFNQQYTQPRKDKQNNQYPKPNKATTYANNAAKRGKSQYNRGTSNASSTRGGGNANKAQ